MSCISSFTWFNIVIGFFLKRSTLSDTLRNELTFSTSDLTSSLTLLCPMRGTVKHFIDSIDRNYQLQTSLDEVIREMMSMLLKLVDYWHTWINLIHNYFCPKAGPFATLCCWTIFPSMCRQRPSAFKRQWMVLNCLHLLKVAKEVKFDFYDVICNEPHVNWYFV